MLEGDDSATEFGTYFVNIDGKGNFEGHIENSWRINGEKTKEEIDVEKGKIVLETDLFVDDINVSVEGLDEQLAYEVLTDEELERVKDGETAVVYVEISEVEAPGKEDSKPLNEKLDELDATPAVYLDIKVWKKVGDDAASPVHETGNREIILIIEVPEEFHNNDEKVERSFYLIRVHEGKADVLAGPTTETTLRVSTNKFSIYTIAYKDRLIDKKDDGGGAYVIPKTAVDNMSYRSLGLFSLALLALVAIVSKKNNQ